MRNFYSLMVSNGSLRAVAAVFFFAVLGFVPLLAQTTYYSQGTGDFGTLSNWNTLPGGGGSSPSSIDASDNFIIQSTHVVTTEANYSINDLTAESGGDFRFDDTNGNITFTINGNLDVDGDLSTTTSGNVVIHSLLLAGNLTGSGNFSGYNDDDGLNGITVNFNGTGTQSLSISGTTLVFYQILVSNTGGQVTFPNSDYTVKNSFTINSGADVVMGSATVTLEHNFIVNATTANFDATTNQSTLQVTGSGSRRIEVSEDQSFHNLTLNKTSGTFTLQGTADTTTVEGTLTITTGSITLSSATLNYGSSSSLLYNGSSAQTTGVEWTSTVNPMNVQVNNGSGLTIDGSGTAGDREIDGDLTLTLGEVVHSEASRTLTVHGDIVGGSGSYGVNTRGTLQLNGESSTNITITQSFNVGNLTVNKSSSAVTVTLTGGSILDMDKGSGSDDSDLDIDVGTFIFNSTSQLNHSGAGSGTHILTMGANGKLRTGGTDVSGFDTHNLDPSSEFIFNGASNEIVETGITYGDLTINKVGGSAEFQTGGGSVTMGASSTLLITAGTFKFNGAVLTLNSNTLTINAGSGEAETNGTDISGFSTYTINGTLNFNGTDGAETIPASISTLANLTIDNGSGVTLGANTSVTGTLTLTNGVLNGGGDTLTVGGSGTISGASSARYMNGVLVRTYTATGSLDFPIGSATDYRPVTANVTTGTGTVTAVYQTVDPNVLNTISGIKNTSTNRKWSINASGPTAFDITLVYTDPGFTIGSENQMRVIRGNSGSSNWEDADSSPTIDSANDKVTASGLDATSGLTDYTVAEAQGSFTWDGGGDGTNWSDATNWVGDTKPQAGDIVTLDASVVASDYSVIFDASTTITTLESITIQPASSQTIDLTLTRSIVLDLTGATALELDDANGGTPQLIFNGTTVIMGGSAYDASTTTFDAGSLAEYSAGTIVHSDAYGSLTVSRSSGTLTAGDAVSVAGNLLKSGGSTFTITDGGLTVSGTSTVSAGTLNINGTGNSTFTGAFTNSATVNLNATSGTCTFTGTYSGAGTLTAAGATPTVTFNGQFNPGGNATFGSQVLNLNSTVNISAGTFTPSTTSNFRGSTFQTSGSGSVNDSTGKVIFIGTSAQTIGSAVTFKDLTINNTGGGVSFSTGSSSATGVFRLTNGILTTGSDTLILTTTATVAGGSATSYVDGLIRRTFDDTQETRTFPLGSGGFYRRIKVTAKTTTASTTSNLTAKVLNDDAINVTSSVDIALEKVSEIHYYDLTNDGSQLQVSSIVDLRVNTDDLVGSFNPNNTLRMARAVGQSGTGVSWSQLTLLSAPNTTTLPVDITSSSFTANIAASGANSSLFVCLATTSETDNPLPVELAVFAVEPGYGKNLVKWSTASELNNEGYFLYRAASEEGPFTQLNPELIPGVGNSSAMQEYEYEDGDVEELTTYYYKLQSRDFDGSIHDYGDVISATVLEVPDHFELAQNYPNPFNPRTTLKFSVAEAGNASMHIYNVVGQRIRTIFDSRRFEPGVYTEYSWDGTDDNARGVVSGPYYLVFTTENGQFRQVRKMVLVR